MSDKKYKDMIFTELESECKRRNIELPKWLKKCGGETRGVMLGMLIYDDRMAFRFARKENFGNARSEFHKTEQLTIS